MTFSREVIINAAWAILMNLEGGGKIHNVPGDPGGTTKFGFSQKYNPDIKVEDLTEEQAKNRFIEKWWDQYRCDDMRQPLAIVFICTIFNTGYALTAYKNSRSYSDAVNRFCADVIIHKYAIHPNFPAGLTIRMMKLYGKVYTMFGGDI